MWDPRKRGRRVHGAVRERGHAAEGFVDSYHVRRPRPFIKPSRRWRLHETAAAGVAAARRRPRRDARSVRQRRRDTRAAREASRAARRVASMAHDPIVDAGEDVRPKTAAAAAAASHGPGDNQEVDEREDRCSDLKVLKALDEEKGLHPTVALSK